MRRLKGYTGFVFLLVIFFLFVGYIFWGGGVFVKDKPVRVIGIVNPPPTLVPTLEGFRAEVTALGYTEGETIRFRFVGPNKTPNDAKKAVTELVKGKVDLILTLGILDTRAAKEVTERLAPELPVVFGVVSSPVESGLVKSVRSSGNNLTGVSPGNSILVSKRLALLRDLVPSASRLVIAWNDSTTTAIADVRRAAQTLGLELVEQQVADAASLEHFLAAFPFKQGDVLVRASDTINALVVERQFEKAREARIPVSGTNIGDAQRGALMSYGADYRAIGRQVAHLADRVFRGESPSRLPIELPENFELIVNQKTAETLGIVLSKESLAKVNRFVR